MCVCVCVCVRGCVRACDCARRLYARIRRYMMFGDNCFGSVIGRLNMMPMMILAAKLCPPGVEATLFSLNMGLSNFGATVG